MKKVWKILIGIGAVIVGILAMSSKGSKKQFKQDLNANKKKLDAVKADTAKVEVEKKKTKKI